MKQIKIAMIISILIFMMLEMSISIMAYVSDSAIVTAGVARCRADDTVEIPINIENNIGGVSVSIVVEYDITVLTLIEVKDTALLPGAMHSTKYISPYHLTWENDTAGNDYIVNGTLVNLIFKVSENASEDDYKIKVRCPRYGVINNDGENVPLLSAFGTVSVYSGNDDPQNASVTGKVSSYNPNNPTTIELQQNGEIKYQQTITSTSGSGKAEQEFLISDVAAGIYDLVVKKENHLSYVITNIVINDMNIDLSAMTEKIYKNITLTPGDINEDGYVNNLDFMIIVSSNNYLKNTSEASNTVADVNGDGYINNLDFMIIVSKDNYMKSVTEINY